ncbi:MAG: four-carbon acid sugar kinase family protein [Synechococcaceae bacterium WB9_2_112]|nr:four-carbon acid sugar kinase family protein [Synechococcaceae bacterium WB9_2_112]
MKVVVFDDDPTGSQTVHGCPLLLRADAASLRQGLQHPSPLLFVLANSRALDPGAAVERVAGIGRSLRAVLAQIADEDARLAARLQPLVLVSRGDSTLRGHFPLELEVIEQELLGGPGGVDARFLVPAFLPGGRTTVDGIHLLQGQPVHTSAFARDGLFGYSTSDLAAYIEAKSGGRVPAAAVQHLTLAELEAEPEALVARLAHLEPGAWVVVDAERPQHLAAFAAATLALMAPAAAARWGRPRRFLFQSAASLLNALVEPELGEPPLAGARLAALRRHDSHGRPGPGLVLVGSHVPLADAQLAHLLAGDPRCRLIEIEVDRLARVLEGPAPSELLASLEAAWLARLREALAAGLTPVLASSRGELPCRTSSERRRLGLELAALMARLVGALAPRLGFVISKGGITSHTLLESGLGCSSVALQGQLLPGLSLVLAGDLPVLTCPGNLGDAQTLQQALVLMQAEQLRPEPAPGPPGC